MHLFLTWRLEQIGMDNIEMLSKKYQPDEG
jgi:hypothetical protein